MPVPSRIENLRGRSTREEVELLLHMFPLVPGTDIPYAAIEELLGMRRRDDTHFTSVLSAWRRRLRSEQNIDTDPLPGQGIRLLRGGERLRVSVRDFTFSVRKSVRSLRRLKATPSHELTVSERQQQEHYGLLIAHSVFEARRARRCLKAPASVQAQTPWSFAC